MMFATPQVGACVPVGRLETDDFDALADVADKYSGGQVRITCEENVLFPNVKNEDVEAMRKEPIFERFPIDAGNLMRGLVSCTGSQFCGFAMIETKNRCAFTRTCANLCRFTIWTRLLPSSQPVLAVARVQHVAELRMQACQTL